LRIGIQILFFLNIHRQDVFEYILNTIVLDNIISTGVLNTFHQKNFFF